MRSTLGSAPGPASALLCALASMMVAAGCGPRSSSVGLGPDPGDAASPPGSALGSSRSLYVRLGGVDGIRAVVDEMVGRMAADHRIQQFFVATDFRRFKGQLVIHLCQLSGGPCRYRGRSMRQVHRGRRIRPAHFEAMIEDARDALRAARVGERERHEVLSMLRGLEPEIVEQP